MSEPIHHFDRPLQIGAAISAGNRLFKDNLGVLVGGWALSFVVIAILGGIMNFANTFLGAMLARGAGIGGLYITTIIQNLIINPILWLIQGVLFFSLFRGQLRAFDRGKLEFGDLFQLKGQAIRYALANLFEEFLRNLPAMVLAIPMAVIASSAGAGTGGRMAFSSTVFMGLAPFWLLLAIIYLVSAPFFLMYTYMVIDHPKTGLIECMKLSFRAGSRNFGPLLGLAFISALASMVGVFACGIGLIFSIPWGACMITAGYRQLVESAVQYRNDPIAAAEAAEASRQQGWESTDARQEDAYNDDGSWDQANPPKR